MATPPTQKTFAGVYEGCSFLSAVNTSVGCPLLGVGDVLSSTVLAVSLAELFITGNTPQHGTAAVAANESYFHTEGGRGRGRANECTRVLEGATLSGKTSLWSPSRSF